MTSSSFAESARLRLCSPARLCGFPSLWRSPLAWDARRLQGLWTDRYEINCSQHNALISSLARWVCAHEQTLVWLLGSWRAISTWSFIITRSCGVGTLRYNPLKLCVEPLVHKVRNSLYALSLCCSPYTWFFKWPACIHNASVGQEAIETGATLISICVLPHQTESP